MICSKSSSSHASFVHSIFVLKPPTAKSVLQLPLFALKGSPRVEALYWRFRKPSGGSEGGGDGGGHGGPR